MCFDPNWVMVYDLLETNPSKVVKAVVKTQLDPFNVATIADKRFLYVTNFTSDSISVIDTQTNQIIDTIILPPPSTVTIDIKPGSDPSSINPKSKGKIPVAILTTDSFDATTVDPTTVRFGRTGTESVPVHAALEDVDLDGDTDMILHFNTQGTGIVCGDTSASLTGDTFGGQAIQGTDSIKTVRCK